jgi:activating signal cointegrator 1
MKALTICQPYAALIVRGQKFVENRPWYTEHRGPLAVHAGLSKDWLDAGVAAHFRRIGDPLVFGAVVGICQLLDVLWFEHIAAGRHDTEYPWLRDHAHVSGPWCWIMGDVQRFNQPVRWRGERALWNFPDDLIPLERTIAPTALDEPAAHAAMPPTAYCG